MPLRILVFADSHLGFDHPAAPRVRRRRRGHDFLANHRRAAARALEGDIDLVIHGGDVFHMPRVEPSLVYQAFEPLREVAGSGVPVFVVPGNHERGAIPHLRHAVHEGIHVFRKPTTFDVRVGGMRVAVAGFPYARRVRDDFGRLLEATGLDRASDADVSLLCMHQCVEGATVGPADFTFRRAPDVIRGSDLPGGVAAVLSGHIHRHQVLTRDLEGAPLPAPVFYPGSVERTAFAEMDERKGYVVLDVEPGEGGGRVVRWRFSGLPARPMVQRTVPGGAWTPEALWRAVSAEVKGAPADAVLRLRVRGHAPAAVRIGVGAGRLRALAPDRNVELVFEADGRRERSKRPTPGVDAAIQRDLALEGSGFSGGRPPVPGRPSSQPGPRRSPGAARPGCRGPAAPGRRSSPP